MAVTTVHAQLIRYTDSGNQIVINLKNTGNDVSIDRSLNTNLPTSATSLQKLANSFGALAFKSSLSKSDVGLGNVDNTADSSKSVKYATSSGSANTVAWSNISSKPTSYPPSTHTHSQYLEKSTYEYSKELACGASDVYILLGAFPCYDSNVTIEIACTSTTSYYGVLMIATQNVSDAGGGLLDLKLYGDMQDALGPKLFVQYVSGSSNVSVYMKGDSWGKYVLHVQANALRTTPTGICTKVSAIPDTANRKPVNVSKTLLDAKVSDTDCIVIQKTTPSKTCLWAKID